MAAAYKEHHFGREEYLREIEANRVSYLKVRDAGKDRSLVFPNWSNPTAEDRTLVYDKGAYVIHLLREELGERAFWAGYTSLHTQVFRQVSNDSRLSKSDGTCQRQKSTAFFSKWVYLSSP